MLDPAPSPRPAPLRAMLAVAAWFFPTAANVAETGPTARGANRTVTVHDFPAPRLVPVQVSAATLKAAEPATETVKAPEGVPPLLASVNTRSGLAPIDTRPYAYWDRSNASTAGPAPADATATGAPSRPTTTETNTAARPTTPRTATPPNSASCRDAKPVPRPPESPAPEPMLAAQISHRQESARWPATVRPMTRIRFPAAETENHPAREP